VTLHGQSVRDDETHARRLAHLRTLSDDVLAEAATRACYVPLDEEIADLARQVIAERKGAS
jgi:hypothetical protein